MTAGKAIKNDRDSFKVVLGLKHLLFTGIGLLVTLAWIFILGVLVGKGEVGRLLAGWGVMNPEVPVKTGLVPGEPSAAAHGEQLDRGTPPGPRLRGDDER